MKYLLKHLVQFTALVCFSVVAYEICMANTYELQRISYDNPETAFFAHLNATSEAVKYSVATAVQQNWQDFGLVRHFIYVFNHKALWLFFGIFVLICYFEFRFRRAEGKILKAHVNKISVAEHEAKKQRQTVEEVHKLINSEAYKAHIKKKAETVVIDPEAEQAVDLQLKKDLDDNQETIFSE